MSNLWLFFVQTCVLYVRRECDVMWNVEVNVILEDKCEGGEYGCGD